MTALLILAAVGAVLLAAAAHRARQRRARWRNRFVDHSIYHRGTR